MQHITNSRFKDAPWYEKSKNESVLLIGLGGIGSNAAYYLTKTILAKYYLEDGDMVDEHNVGTQFFAKNQVGQYKVEAMQNVLQRYSTSSIFPLKTMHDTNYLPIMITGLDNMKSRKHAFEVWKSKNDRELFIDGRLRANLYEIYIVTPGRESEYEKTLFDDSEVDDGPCTFKQTAYFAGLIGSRIAHVLVNYLTNKYSEDPVCSLPFSIKEVGDLFYVEITEFEEKVAISETESISTEELPL